jgi:hypothetical protein
VGQAELFPLVRVRNKDIAVLVAVTVDYLFGLVADYDDEFGGSSVDQIFEDVFNERRVVDLNEYLRFVVSERAETCAPTCGENNTLHTLHYYTYYK